jgi:hypothetical protein
MPKLPDTIFLVVIICVTLLLVACGSTRDPSEDIAPVNPEVPTRSKTETSSTSDEQIFAPSESAADTVNETVDVTDSGVVEPEEDATLKISGNESQETAENSKVQITGIEGNEQGSLGLPPGEPENLGAVGGDEENAAVVSEAMMVKSMNELAVLLNLQVSQIRVIDIISRE